MNAAAIEFANDEVTPKATFYSQSVGVIFNDRDAVRNNAWLKQEMSSMGKELITKKDGQTSFQIESDKLGYFMHMMYASMTDGFVLQADFDGIYQFVGTDNKGDPALYNAQLITIRQVHDSMSDGISTMSANLH